MSLCLKPKALRRGVVVWIPALQWCCSKGSDSLIANLEHALFDSGFGESYMIG